MTQTGFENVQTAKVNGAHLAWREQGQGEPVVFVHGGLSDLRTWERQLPAVGRSYRAITYSRRYARPNEDIDPDADDPMDPHVEDLAAFLRETGAAPAHLVGNSWGAFVALLTAVRHPDVVRSLVLEEPPVLTLFGLSTPPGLGELLGLFLRNPAAAVTLMRFATGTVAPVQKAFREGEDEQAMQIFIRGVLGEGAFQRLPAARAEQMRENLSALRAQILGAGFPPLGEEEVRRVHAPTLLLLGERSPAIFVRLTERLEKFLPNVERRVIPGASHAMHEEKPEVVNEAIVSFLAKHAGPAAFPTDG